MLQIQWNVQSGQCERFSERALLRHSLKADSLIDFGLVIAYVLPGALVLWGVGQLSPTVQMWVSAASADSTSVGGFFCVVLAALGAGLVASTLRWLTIDTLHHLTGLCPPTWDFAQLANRTEAFKLLIEIHYKYYQFYGNSLIAFVFTYAVWRGKTLQRASACWWMDVIALLLTMLFFAGSRDTLRRYYDRGEALLQNEKECRGNLITLLD